MADGTAERACYFASPGCVCYVGRLTTNHERIQAKNRDVKPLSNAGIPNPGEFIERRRYEARRLGSKTVDLFDSRISLLPAAVGRGKCLSRGDTRKSSGDSHVWNFSWGWFAGDFRIGDLRQYRNISNGWCAFSRVDEVYLRIGCSDTCSADRFDCHVRCQLKCDKVPQSTWGQGRILWCETIADDERRKKNIPDPHVFRLVDAAGRLGWRRRDCLAFNSKRDREHGLVAIVCLDCDGFFRRVGLAADGQNLPMPQVQNWPGKTQLRPIRL